LFGFGHNVLLDNRFMVLFSSALSSLAFSGPYKNSPGRRNS
jgi:hypothetical protein